MAQQRQDTEKAIIKRLQELTSNPRKIKWEHKGQVYRARFFGRIFEIVDSGQGWIKIKYESGAAPIIIMDQHEEVESLLVTIKRLLFVFEIDQRYRISNYDLDQELNRILGLLNQEV